MGNSSTVPRRGRILFFPFLLFSEDEAKKSLDGLIIKVEDTGVFSLFKGGSTVIYSDSVLFSELCIMKYINLKQSFVLKYTSVQ